MSTLQAPDSVAPEQREQWRRSIVSKINLKRKVKKDNNNDDSDSDE
jgi:hypothetical protein